MYEKLIYADNNDIWRQRRPLVKHWLLCYGSKMVGKILITKVTKNVPCTLYM